MSDRLTLNGAVKEEGAASTDRLRKLEAGLIVIGGDDGQGAPRMAAGRRLAIAPAALGPQPAIGPLWSRNTGWSRVVWWSVRPAQDPAFQGGR
jgi:hypothetical protein